MEHLLKLSDRLRSFASGVGMLAAWSSVILIAVIVFDVVGRHFFSSGSSRLQELEWHLHTVLFMGCLGLGYVCDTHVRIDLVRERLGTRVQCWIEILGCVFFLFPLCGVLIYYGVGFTHAAWAVGEVSSSATGLTHRWIIKAAIPLGAILLFVAGTGVLLRNIACLVRPDLCPDDACADEPRRGEGRQARTAGCQDGAGIGRGEVGARQGEATGARSKPSSRG